MAMKKLLVASAASLLAPSFRPMSAVLKNKSIKHPKSHIIEIDYAAAGNHKSIGGADVAKRLLTAVYSFVDTVYPSLSPCKKLQNLLNMMDNGDDDTCARWHVMESADALCMVRHMSATTEEEADVRVGVDMEEAPKALGYRVGASILGTPKIKRVLFNPSATLHIEKNPRVELEPDESFLVTVELPSTLFHTNATTIEATERGGVKITVKKLRPMRILSLLCSVHRCS